MQSEFPVINCDPSEIISSVLLQDQRVLLFGPPGVGKSTLSTNLASQLALNNRQCFCLSADPGSPGFGIPGVLSLAKWENTQWQVIAIEALCTLDAGRFRLPVIAAVQRLAKRTFNGVLLIDGPGVARGIAGKELLTGLIDAASVNIVLTLTQSAQPPPLPDELRASATRVFVVQAAESATRPGKRTRARQRTECWNAYLAHHEVQKIDLSRINIIGTPPPLEISTAWIGRQIALLQQNGALALGEVVNLEQNELQISLPHSVKDYDTLLVRDVQRNINGLMETAEPFITEQLEYLPPSDIVMPFTENSGPRIVGRVGALTVSLVNGVFGDPLLHVRMRHKRRSMLFDLGEGNRLSARVAHQVTDVFISHAHVDHIGGFLWLLRSRIGEFPACRIYGPPGLAANINGFIQGILWDRVANRGPVFEVYEIHDNQMQCFQLQAGNKTYSLGEKRKINGGIILNEVEFKIRAVILDHKTPVVAYAYEPISQLNIRKEMLAARGLSPGKWLGELKDQILAESFQATILLPNNIIETVADLAKDLILITPGKKLVYATDFADSEQNRQRITELAKNAHTFFCESAFVEADIDHARQNGHLTTRACGEIATQAGVARLVPFHFSQRYVDDPESLYEEISMFCQQLVRPKSMHVFEKTERQENAVELE